MAGNHLTTESKSESLDPTFEIWCRTKKESLTFEHTLTLPVLEKYEESSKFTHAFVLNEEKKVLEFELKVTSYKDLNSESTFQFGSGSSMKSATPMVSPATSFVFSVAKMPPPPANPTSSILVVSKSTPEKTGVHFFLCLNSAENIDVRAEIYRIMENGEQRKFYSGPISFSPLKKDFRFYSWPNIKNTLTNPAKIVCEISLEAIAIQLQKSAEKELACPMSLSLPANITKMFEESAVLPHTDVSLICREEIYPCHKFMLSARSSVFSETFNQSVEEPADIDLVLNDTEPHILGIFIKFIYTDCLKDGLTFEDASLLLQLADKYNIGKLKMICEKIICELIDLTNVIDATFLGYRHKASHLLPFAIKTVTSNLKYLIERQEFDKIIQKCPEVLLEILKNISENGGSQGNIFKR